MSVSAPSIGREGTWSPSAEEEGKEAQSGARMESWTSGKKPQERMEKPNMHASRRAASS